MIEPDGNEPNIVESMLKFIYTSDYSDGRTITHVPTTNAAISTPLQCGSSSRPSRRARLNYPRAAITTASTEFLLINAKVYIIGDQLDVLPLKALPMKKYEEMVAIEWNTASSSQV